MIFVRKINYNIAAISGDILVVSICISGFSGSSNGLDIPVKFGNFPALALA